MDKNLLMKLVSEGVITIPSFLFRYYKKIGLNDIECMLILHLHSFIEKGNTFPTYEQFAERMVQPKDQCAQTLASLIQRGYIEITKSYDDKGIYIEKYSLNPLWERLVDQYILGERKEDEVQQEMEEGLLYSLFEQEFGRPLSPIEMETLGMWIDNDQHSPALIKQALKEAVLSGKLSFRYIDRILFEWKKNGIKTVSEAEEQGRKFRIHQKKNLPEEKRKKTDTVPFYNWLEN